MRVVAAIVMLFAGIPAAAVGGFWYLDRYSGNSGGIGALLVAAFAFTVPVLLARWLYEGDVRIRHRRSS